LSTQASTFADSQTLQQDSNQRWAQKSLEASGHIEMRTEKDLSEEQKNALRDKFEANGQGGVDLLTASYRAGSHKLRESTARAQFSGSGPMIYWKTESEAIHAFEHVVEKQSLLEGQSRGIGKLEIDQGLGKRKEKISKERQKIENKILQQYGEESKSFKYTQIMQRREAWRETPQRSNS
jgi:hypothetical protein